MFRLLTRVPKTVFVAVSGGPDSMAALDFLRRSHEVVALHFNHGTEHGKEAEKFVVEAMRKYNIPLIVGHITRERGKDESKEDFWRKERYLFFKKVAQGNALVMAHTLDDAMETWLFTSMHGKPKVIPYERYLMVKSGPDEKDNGMTTCDWHKKYSIHIIRPFLLARKTDMIDWCKRKNVPYVIDPGNADLAYPRVRIRKVILPEILKVNIGLPKVIAKKYMENIRE